MNTEYSCLPEGELLALARAGNEEAFTTLVRQNSPMIYKISRRVLKNHEDAEDAMQEAFLKAYSHLDSFQGASRFYTWLVRIAANEALMRLRRRRPGMVSLDEPIQGETDLMPRELEDWGANPEQRYAQSELEEILSEFVDKLEPEYRIVLVLRDVEELSAEETSEALGISISAVKSRLLRGRLKLREKLSRYLRLDVPN